MTEWYDYFMFELRLFIERKLNALKEELVRRKDRDRAWYWLDTGYSMEVELEDFPSYKCLVYIDPSGELHIAKYDKYSCVREEAIRYNTKVLNDLCTSLLLDKV